MHIIRVAIHSMAKLASKQEKKEEKRAKLTLHVFVIDLVFYAVITKRLFPMKSYINI